MRQFFIPGNTNGWPQDNRRGNRVADDAILSEPVSTIVVMAREGRRREAGTDRLYLILYGSIPYPPENPRRSLNELEPARPAAPVFTEIFLFLYGILPEAVSSFILYTNRSMHFRLPLVWLGSRPMAKYPESRKAKKA